MIYGYARVSTDRQENSAEAQTSRLTDYCRQSGLEFGQIFVDQDQSAYRIPLRKREYGKLLWDALQPGDTLVFTKIDRCFRSLQDQCNTLATWEEMGIKVVILDMPIQYDDPYGRCTLAVIGSTSQLASELTGQRVREVNAYLKKAGRPYGRSRPFGWVVRNKAYVPCEEERKTGQLVLDMRRDGVTFPGIALALCKMGIRKPCKSQGTAGWYALADVWNLHRAAQAGYPTIPPGASIADWHAYLQRAAESGGDPQRHAV